MDAFAHGSQLKTPISSTKTRGIPAGSGRIFGGSAAAVALIWYFSIGVRLEVDQPASWCRVTGLKPSTAELVDTVWLVWLRTDSPGPITKDVKDSAYVLNIAEDPRRSSSPVG